VEAAGARLHGVDGTQGRFLDAVLLRNAREIGIGQPFGCANVKWHVVVLFLLNCARQHEHAWRCTRFQSDARRMEMAFRLWLNQRISADVVRPSLDAQLLAAGPFLSGYNGA
jgi:hypothetical protein